MAGKDNHWQIIPQRIPLCIMSHILGYIRLHGHQEPFRPQTVLDCLGGHGHTAGDSAFCIGSTDGLAWDGPEDDNSTRACAFSGHVLNADELKPQMPDAASPGNWCLTLEKKHGADFADRLSGAFACAIMDRQHGRLLLVCDPLGLHPLFICRLSCGFVLFSDSLAVLSRMPLCPAGMDAAAIADFLSLGYVPSPRTIRHGIRKLPGGHWLQLRMGGGLPAIHRYWHPAFMPKAPLTMRAAVEQAWELLDRAVSRCTALLGTAPGVLLSGGIDSNLVLALGTTAPVPVTASYTVGFSENTYDERGLAERSAKALGVPHSEREIHPQDWERLGSLLEQNGEPFADSSLIPTAAVMELAKDGGASGVLSGSGGDEVFGGYRRYQAMQLRARLGIVPGGFLRCTGRIGMALTPSGAGDRSRLSTIRRFSSFLCQDVLHGYASFQEIFSDDMKETLVRDWTLRHEPSYLDAWSRLLEDGTGDSMAEDFNELDVLTYLPDDGSVKESLAAASAGIPCLSPLLDMDVVRFGLSLPHALRMTLRERKRVLRRLGRNLLTPELLKQTKRGFGMPVSQWFRGPCRELALALAADVRQWDAFGWLDAQAVQRLVDDHLAERADHGARLWTLHCLRTWLEHQKGWY